MASRRARQAAEDATSSRGKKEIEKRPKGMEADPEKEHQEQLRGQPATTAAMAGNPHTDAATARAAGGPNTVGGGLGAAGDQDEIKAKMARDAELAAAPRFDDDGNPIDEHGRPRVLAPGEAGQDEVERALYTAGKGGVTVRGKYFGEGESVMLSEEEANQVMDMGNLVVHSDPVEDKGVQERRAERQEKRREAAAQQHEKVSKEHRQEF